MPSRTASDQAAHGLRERNMVHALVISLLLAGGAGCGQPNDPGEVPGAQAVVSGSITLTYICGNTFRVRNTNPTQVEVTWDVYQKSESGTLSLPPKPATLPYSETYFTTINKGTVRLFEGGQLIQTKANGNKPACQTPADTARPAMPAFGYPDDAAFTVASPDTAVHYYRRLLTVHFSDSTSGSTVRRVLASYGATVVGGLPYTSGYIVQVPDPGIDLAALVDLRRRLSEEPGVDLVTLVRSKSAGPSLEVRAPNDGAGFGAADWRGGIAGPRASWGLRSIRAPLAWGCETGEYSPDRVRIAVVEWGFDNLHPDLLPSSPVVYNAPVVFQTPVTGSQSYEWQWHGTAVAGVLTASGNTGSGTAGVMWRTDLRLYGLGNGLAQPKDVVLAFSQQLLPRVELDQPRVLSLSMEIQKDPLDPDLGEVLARGLRRLLRGSPQTLVVKASGNRLGSAPESLTPGFIRDSLSSGAFLLVEAILRVRDSLQYRERTLLVGGSDTDSTWWRSGAIYIQGETDIAAPAADVGLLGSRFGGTLGGDVIQRSGTSFAAPMVAGIAAQLVAMDPTLRASEVKEYVLAGAREPREDSTGQMVLRRPLGDTPVGAVLYQADAYGSLRKLSADRHGTPVCGLLVSNAVQRASPEPIVVDGESVSFTSIAQGGRLAARSNEVFRLSGGTWRREFVADAGTSLVFLEQDTAYVRDIPNLDYTRFDIGVRIGSTDPNRRVAERVVSGGLPATGSPYAFSAYDAGTLRVDPTGRLVYYDWFWSINSDCLDGQPARGGFSSTIVELTTGTTWGLGGGGFQNPSCDTPPSQYPPPPSQSWRGWIAWSPAGDAFYYARDYYVAQSTLERWSVLPSVVLTGPVTTLAADALETLLWSPEGNRVLTAEVQNSTGTCVVRTRAALTLALLPGPDGPCGVRLYGPSFLTSPRPVGEIRAPDLLSHIEDMKRQRKRGVPLAATGVVRPN